MKDLRAAGVAGALFLVAAGAAGVLQVTGHPVHASAAPLFAHWLPHVGPGTPLAVVLAFLACRYGPGLADRLPWRHLLAASYATAVAWTLSLALIDGWQRGVAGRLTTRPEYLTEVPGVISLAAMVRGFSGRILDGQPDSWTTHVSGHPPGALLLFAGLDRIGLSGGAWAGLVCIAVGALIAVAVPVTVRLIGSEEAGRAAVPFVSLFPGAIWIGVSADGLFAGVVAGGIALFAIGVVRRAAVAALAGGLLLAVGAYLSYGLVLMVVVAAAVLVAAPAGWRMAGWAAVGAVAVVGAWTAAGFDWLTGYDLVIQRYYQGLAAHRPYAYWVWANLAILVVAAGPAAAAIVRRATLGLGPAMTALRTTPRATAAPARPVVDPARPAGVLGPTRSVGVGGLAPPAGALGPSGSVGGAGLTRPAAVVEPARSVGVLGAAGRVVAAGRMRSGVAVAGRVRRGLAALAVPGRGFLLLPLAAVGAILLADLSGYSKAEVERIWLPFAVWLMAGAALLPARTRRHWLIAQAVVALVVNHIVLTVW
ncbi:hypothetical protein [Paractinoplanes toevensis]|uniref:Integral membrane protein n=1 Tax=Paractinoplanes toevensis TaxID=571911 RepID=A0A919T8D6_9ACTN|nr:hypothetical protein [Actinoplanes toevensis]GIM89755.1 hypothetical protein Ato02nite_015480 [Actinoplanes toevensis]